MPDHDNLSAEAALREVDRARDAVRRSSRRGAYLYLGMWLAVTACWLVMFLGPAAIAGYVTPALGVITMAGFVYASRQRAYSRLHSRLPFPVTYAFVGTTVIGVSGLRTRATDPAQEVGDTPAR
ncbi:hypothetical protein [Streptosporangium pseudovulgare]|uniref:DUF3040 domain-containing protein n=1 Tax=Streptosporangium pseudovulgare TaxID=35765 RepID=A0ABQ2RAQ8_9ACTN|nr:hypothetical protein [Streptosporangium pseudovulgare]GGQ18727.1 hypothetical protein GCM10010140_56500 [Streptosporangium pseudovulgare]